MTNEITSFFVTILAAGIRIATPVLFAAMGETIIEKSGVLNIGIEGTNHKLPRSDERGGSNCDGNPIKYVLSRSYECFLCKFIFFKNACN